MSLLWMDLTFMHTHVLAIKEEMIPQKKKNCVYVKSFTLFELALSLIHEWVENFYFSTFFTLILTLSFFCVSRLPQGCIKLNVMPWVTICDTKLISFPFYAILQCKRSNFNLFSARETTSFVVIFVCCYDN